jgi:hypothetical protein
MNPDYPGCSPRSLDMQTVIYALSNGFKKASPVGSVFTSPDIPSGELDRLVADRITQLVESGRITADEVFAANPHLLRRYAVTRASVKVELV